MPEAAPDRESQWAPLRNRTFRALWIANVFSAIGTWIHQVGAAWLMTDLAPTPVLVSLVQASAGLAMFLFVLPAGVLADVLDRRRVLLASQLWLMVSAVVLGLLTVTGGTTPALLLVFTFLMGTGGALMQPAWRAVLPELVPQRQLPAAIDLVGLGVNLARAVGPAAGGLLVAGAGAGAAFLLNAVTYLGVVTVVAGWKRPIATGAGPAEQFVGALRAGIRYARHTPQMNAVLVRLGLFVLPASALWALLPLIARVELGTDAAGYGWILAAFGLGAVTGALTLGRLRERLSLDRIATTGTLFFGSAMIGIAFVRLWPAFLVLSWIAGIGWLHILTTLNTAAQTVLPGWVRARGMALFVLVFFLASTLGSMLWGAVASQIGLTVTIVLAGVAVIVGTGARYRFRIKNTVGLDLAPTRHWPAPTVAEPIEPEEGPVLVSVGYQVDPGKLREFEVAMSDLRRRRRRSGAYFWDLFVDSADPDRHIEVFMVDSWAEHLRQHERVTALDRVAESRVQACLVEGEYPRVQHFLASRGWRSRLRPRKETSSG
ncbi:MAG: MFS transporter [marine benthic group bacterium]|nr:MFS transporter [Gemmatimonadota bacterium]MCL7969256.1 MFS transporter [Gemmatimonadota bacterium]